MINFTRGVPPTEAFPTGKLQECAQSILETYSSTILQYHPAMGFVPLREWIGSKYNVSPEKVLVSNGSLQIHGFLSDILTKPGDAVLVEKPSYDRAITAFRKRGLEVIGVPLEEDGIALDPLASIIIEKRPKFIYIIPDFQNPSGVMTSLFKRESLINLAEEYNFWILEDNPYRELRYWGEDIPSIFSLGSEKVLFTSSFSKVLSPGMRVGYLIGPEDVIGQTARCAEDTYITPNMLSQGIVFEYCRRGYLEPGIDQLKDLYRPRLKTLISALETHMSDTKWTAPEGGFFMGVYLPANSIQSNYRSKALELEIKLSDGNGFFVDGGGESFLRLPFCALTESEILEGIKRLGSITS